MGARAPIVIALASPLGTREKSDAIPTYTRPANSRKTPHLRHMDLDFQAHRRENKTVSFLAIIYLPF